MKKQIGNSMRTCIAVKWKHFKQTEATSGNVTWPKGFISTEILIQLYYKSFVFDTKKICMSLSSNHIVDGWKKRCVAALNGELCLVNIMS